jgi:putative aldouronate transport system substrate-binding protein
MSERSTTNEAMRGPVTTGAAPVLATGTIGGSAATQGSMPTSSITARRSSRRSLLRAGLTAGGAALGTRVWFPLRAGAQATPAATPGVPTPPGLTAGVDYFPSPGAGVPAVYVNLPTRFASVAKPPGRGGPVSVLQPTVVPPVPGRSDNGYWQELERRLNVRWDMTIVPIANYAERFATTVAGGELPDLMWTNDPTVPELVQQGAFADLTEHLSGDALQEYPNLAALDPKLWQNSSIGGRIYRVPRANELLFAGSTLMFRQDWADTAGIPRPADADQFARLLRAFTAGDPDGDGAANTWGLGSAGNFNLDFLGMIFRRPNVWRQNGDGSLTYYLETEEHRRSLEYASRLWAEGLYHPDAASMTVSQAKDAFVAGVFGGYSDGISGLPTKGRLRDRAKRVNPDANAVGLVPFGHDGGPGVYFTGPGFYGGVLIPADRDQERIRELLRILDFYAAPTGSEERVFLDFGLEGTHHTVQPDGALVKTDQGSLEIGNMPYLIRGAEGLYFPETPGDAQYLQGLVAELMTIRVDNPAVDLFAPSAVEQGSVLGQLIDDTHLNIVTGRDPLSSLDQAIENWRGRGGDQIREELQAALAAR